MMICLNAMEKAEGVHKGQWKAFIRLLAPFAPHVAEELWERLGEEYSVHQAVWPQYDPRKLISEQIVLAVQVNGKVRGTISLPIDTLEEVAIQVAQKDPKIALWLAQGEVKKVIYIGGKVINFVVDKN